MVSSTLGHDIPSDELLKFWSELEKSCSSGGACPLSEEEELFKDVILPFAESQKPFVVISFSIDNDWYIALSHEVLHAQYFLDSKYQEVVDGFWRDVVREEDKIKIKSILGRFYNQNDEFLMRNEFQAYVLQAQAMQSSLQEFVKRYQEELIKKLTEVGSAPLGLK